MQKLIGLLCGLLLICGCASHKSHSPDKPKPAPKPVVTPDLHPIGTVAKVDANGRFVVISFPVGQMPQPDDRLNVYRNGLKVAEVKVDAKYQMNGNAIADIITGDVQVGDEARQN